MVCLCWSTAICTTWAKHVDLASETVQATLYVSE
jgi:hypothetical protein